MILGYKHTNLEQSTWSSVGEERQCLINGQKLINVNLLQFHYCNLVMENNALLWMDQHTTSIQLSCVLATFINFHLLMMISDLSAKIGCGLMTFTKEWFGITTHNFSTLACKTNCILSQCLTHKLGLLETLF